MGNKGFVILCGEENIKDNFIDKLKKDYWVWSSNPLSFLRHNASQLGWEFTNEYQANEFIQKLLTLSNDYLDYEYEYVKKLIAKTLESTKALDNGMAGDVLIVSAGKELRDRLMGEYDFDIIQVANTECVEDNFQHDRFLIGMNDTDENIEKSIENVFLFVMKEY